MEESCKICGSAQSKVRNEVLGSIDGCRNAISCKEMADENLALDNINEGVNERQLLLSMFSNFPCYSFMNF